MMKKIILAIGLMFGGVAFVNAQEQQQDTTQNQTQQSDQYRSDTTSTDDSVNQDQTQSDTTSTEQSDMYRTQGEGNVSDSTANDAASQTTTGTESTTDSQSTSDQSTTSEQSTTGQPTMDDQQSTSSQTGVSQDDQEQEGEKVEVSELPAAVQTKLQSTDYQGWVVSSARKKMWSDPSDPQATSKEVYVIEAKNGSETKKLKFDKDGNEIEHDKHKKDDQK